MAQYLLDIGAGLIPSNSRVSQIGDLGNPRNVQGLKGGL